jgi:flagellar hook-associated protein 2
MSTVSGVNSLLSSTTTPAVNVSSLLAAATGATTPGIDVTAAVAAAIYGARAPERIWQAQQATLASQTAALTAIQTATAALAADMTALNTLSGPLSARTVTSSNTSAVTATAASGTIAGSHTIAVQNVATTGSWYSDLASSATAALPVSSFTITTKADPTNPSTITVGSNGINSLTDIANAINTGTTGLKATVVSDSSGSRLAILASTSGTAADFTITTPPNTTATSWASPPLPTGGTLGVNTITLSSGAGTPQTITTTAGDTYATLATSINALGLDLTASVVTDSNGSHLNIVSNDTVPFTINQPSFNYTQANSAPAVDAKLTVDGVPITSASNQVTGALSGVTLSLVGTTNVAGLNLTVASDASKVATAVNQFVTDYNTAIGLVSSQYVYNSATSSQGVLSADPTVRSLQSALLQAVSYVNTPATGTTTISSLSDLGISTGTDGTLTLDASTFTSAITNNASDVQNFFQGVALNGFASTLTTGLSTFTDPGSGAFTVDLRSISNTSLDLTKHISDFESIYIANQQTVLSAMYSKAEIALQQLPTQMAQIQAMLGNSKSGS